jgi:hypothetical protein
MAALDAHDWIDYFNHDYDSLNSHPTEELLRNYLRSTLRFLSNGEQARRSRWIGLLTGRQDRTMNPAAGAPVDQLFEGITRNGTGLESDLPPMGAPPTERQISRRTA